MSEPAPLPPLPPPAPDGVIYAYPARGTLLPDLRPATPARPWMTKTSGRHAYRCLPLVQGCTQGWEVLSPVDFAVTWIPSGKGQEHENTDRLHVDVAGRPGRSSDFVTSFHGYGIVSMMCGYAFRTPAGVSLLLRGPANRPKRGIHALEALVETDWYAGLSELAFSWQVTNPGETIRFARGEPIGMVVPVPRGYAGHFTPELVDTPPEFERHEEAWRAARREDGDGPYSPTGKANLRPSRASYRLGLGLDGQRVADRRLRGPRPFVDRRTSPTATEAEPEPPLAAPTRPRRLLTAEQADLLDQIAGAQEAERRVAADLGPRIRSAERAVLRGATKAERLVARDEADRLLTQLHAAQRAARVDVSRNLAALRRAFGGELVVPPGHGLRVVPEGGLRYVEVVELPP
ncbi:MAG: DUF6065 family protein [Planctomycetes bacterium]|nr:DUF6065 family protein [Planctomycetota bacterium]